MCKMQSENFHDTIAEKCLECFNSLPKSGKPNKQEWTVLSGIVQEIKSNLTVVAMGTGSKCIGKTKMSSKGDTLNDSHAEVICRRSFLKYIYREMIGDSDILKFNENLKRFSIKSEVKFHFFTTHVPCGDAAIFLKQDLSEFGNILDNCEDIPTKKMKLDSDIFRTGAKCVEKGKDVDSKLPGIEYHVTGVVRTKPGRGDPTLSVSCSDKIAKWTHVGVQGALLSLLLEEPIYLSSFTIAGNTPFSEKSLERAFYKRLGEVSLRRPYKQHKMIIGQSSRGFAFAKEDNKQPCPSSISYCVGIEKSVEVAVEGKRQGVTKKNLNTEIGRLQICKLELFKHFLKVCDKQNIVLKTGEDNFTSSYGHVKLFSKEYREAWEDLRQSFKIWTCKNGNLLNFLGK